MRIEGRTQLSAKPLTVWAALQDPAKLRTCIPGCQRLEAVDADHYVVAVELAVAGIKGRYEGELTISDRNPGAGYVLHVKGEGAPGMVEGQIRITLAEEGAGTLLSYDGEVDIGGRIARVGQRVMSGVSKMLIGQFMKCLASRL